MDDRPIEAERELAELIREAKELIERRLRGEAEGDAELSPAESALERFRREYVKRVGATIEARASR